MQRTISDIAEALMPPPADLLVGASVFLDFDGTLVELEDRPDAVIADNALLDLVGGLNVALDGRVAIVTGRAVAHVKRLFGDVAVAIGGSHGVEFAWPDGRTHAPDAPADLAAAAAAFEAFADRHDGVLLERKPFGTGLHYRMAPEYETAARALAAELAGRHALKLQPGKMMVELRAAIGDKGSAIERLMADPPFAGTRPVFVGDDVTDEDGFVAAARLGGVGVLVGTPRPTAAQYRLGGVGEVRTWLAQAIGMAA